MATLHNYTSFLIFKIAPILETEIDRLVYELYGLSEEEIGIVEGEK
jgi:hypothetical protein